MILQRPMLNKLLLFCMTIFILSSCNSDVVFSKYQKFDENEWYAKDKAVFDIDITDTLTLNNISLMVRHADSYPYSNLFLFVTTVLQTSIGCILPLPKSKHGKSGYLWLELKY